jgi:hypothetical protein
MRWDKVVDVEADAAAALAVAAGVGRAGWVAPRLPGRAATASAPTAGTKCRTWQASPATRSNAPSAVRR